MLQIMEGVIKFVKEDKSRKSESGSKESLSPNPDNVSDDEDRENSSVDGVERRLEIVEELNENRVVNEVTDTPLNLKISETSSEKSSSEVKASWTGKEDESLQLSFDFPEKSSQKSKLTRKRTEKIELTEEEIEAEFPKLCRKRKFPTHLTEYAIPFYDDKEEEDEERTEIDDVPFKLSPKQKSPKRKKELKPVPEAKSSSHEDTCDLVPKNNYSSPISPKKNIIEQINKNSFGICSLCGLRFDEQSKKLTMQDNTRETGQTFANVLQSFFLGASLSNSLKEEFSKVDVDEGYLCTLCVSYIEQYDVFQKKLNDIKLVMINVFSNKTKDDTQILQIGSDGEEADAEEVKTPKKRGRPPKPKSDKIVTLLYKSPLKKMKEEVMKHVPKDENEKSDNEAVARKLSTLSGIEIKRVNVENGSETEVDLNASSFKSPPSEAKFRKKTSPKMKNVEQNVSDDFFNSVGDELQDELQDSPPLHRDPQPTLPLADPVKHSVPKHVGHVRSPTRGRGRGRPSLSSYRPPPPPQPKSKKSLFERSQERRRSGTPLVGLTSLSPASSPISQPPTSKITNSPPQYIINGIELNSSDHTSSPTLTTIHSVPVISPSLSVIPKPISMSTPIKSSDETSEDLKQKKAYRKLVSRIQRDHPELSFDETIEGIIAVRKDNNGTLTGMSMQEIVAKVHLTASTSSGKVASAPIGDEFEKMVNAPLLEEDNLNSSQVKEENLFEIKCLFCSRVFKSSSESATKKVYQIHMYEHEIENRNIYDNSEVIDDPETSNEISPKSDLEGAQSKVLVKDAAIQRNNESQCYEKENLPFDRKGDPDPVKSESSYCKPCHKQFKNTKLYGTHQNTEHAAEKEFEKILEK